MTTNKRKSENQLLVVRPTGEYRFVPCTYEGIKDGVDGSGFDFVHNDVVGMYVDDTGMIDELEFNAPASMFMARALWGPVVLTSSRTNDEGDTLPASREAVESLMAISRIWQHVLADSIRLGQTIITRADDETLPPPQVFAVNDDEFGVWMATGKLPDREPDA